MDSIDTIIKELQAKGITFVLIYDNEDSIEFAANTSEEEATDMMIAALHNLRFSEE